MRNRLFKAQLTARIPDPSKFQKFNYGQNSLSIINGYLNAISGVK